MKPVIRAIVAPLVVIGAAWGLARLHLQWQEGKLRREAASERPATPEKIFALRVAAIQAANSLYQVELAAEKEAYAREKKEADFPELAELGHEVRLMRIELDRNTTLAAIDKKYPPAHPVPETPADPPPEPAP